MSKTKSTSHRDQVQKILETLHKHSEVISLCLAGRVTDVDAPDSIGKGISALTSVGALLPMGDGAYQLNPRIRRFLNERLSQFSALQALTRISEQLQSGRAQWKELIEIQASGDFSAKAEIEDALIYTAGEIVYFMRQNLRLLNHQTATDFGNVESMKRKLRQNRFYSDNVKALITELDQLEVFLSTVESQSLQFNLFEIRSLLMGQISSQMGYWRHQLNEIQSLISQRLFVRRQVEQDLKLLFDVGLWLETNPTRNGLDVELGQKARTDLLSPIAIKIRPHYDVLAKGLEQENFLRTVASKLPAAKSQEAPKEPRQKQRVISTEQEIEEAELNLEDVLIRDLVELLNGNAIATPFPIRQWEREKRLAAGIGDEEWLLYASNQLAVLGIRTELNVSTGEDTFNTVFDDVIAYPA